MPTASGRKPSRRALTDYFLHDDFYADADVLHRARVLISALYAFAGFTLAMIPLALLLLPMEPLIQLLVAISCILTSMAFVYLLLLLKRRGRYTFCAAMAISIPLVAIVTSTAVTGGIFQSPTSQLLVLQPLVAFFFAGIRGGYIATIIIALLIAVLAALQWAGVEFPQLIPASYVGLMWSGLLLVGFFVIAVMAVVYEFTSTTLRRERDKEHARVVQLANTDALTGLANRRAFDNALNARISAFVTREDVSQFALCYLDLDGFKAINDQHGHDVGDQVLRAVSIRLRSALRGADLVARQGGDEFMLLLNGIGANQSLEIMADRLINMIRQPIETSADLVSVGASLGFAVHPKHARSVDILKKSADTAMYEAKRNNHGWRLYTPDMNGTTTDNEFPA